MGFVDDGARDREWRPRYEVSAPYETRVVVGTEDRMPSDDRGIGRLRKTKIGTYQFCTATLVSPHCAVTAAHCRPVFGVLEFDLEIVPNAFRFARPENLFEVDLARSFLSEGVKGDDWAVLRLKPNKKTKKPAGEGRPLRALSSAEPYAQQEIVVIGYGSADNLYSFSQQRGTGVLTQVVPASESAKFGFLEHDADTGGGSSGAALIDAATGDIIGIHTHGDTERLMNSGTRSAGNAALAQAIRACASESSEAPSSEGL